MYSSLTWKSFKSGNTAWTHPLHTSFSPNSAHKLSKIISGTYIPMFNLEIHKSLTIIYDILALEIQSKFAKKKSFFAPLWIFSKRHIFPPTLELDIFQNVCFSSKCPNWNMLRPVRVTITTFIQIRLLCYTRFLGVLADQTLSFWSWRTVSETLNRLVLVVFSLSFVLVARPARALPLPANIWACRVDDDDDPQMPPTSLVCSRSACQYSKEEEELPSLR